MAYHIFIYGRVHGVGFRFFTLEKAKEIGLKGWVQNNYDGSVEIMIQGEEEKLDLFVSEIEMGNELSIIEFIDIRQIYEEKEYKHFEIKY